MFLTLVSIFHISHSAVVRYTVGNGNETVEELKEIDRKRMNTMLNHILQSKANVKLTASL